MKEWIRLAVVITVVKEAGKEGELVSRAMALIQSKLSLRNRIFCSRLQHLEGQRDELF